MSENLWLGRRACISKIISNICWTMLHRLRRKRQTRTKCWHACSSSTTRLLIGCREFFILFRFSSILSIFGLIININHRSIFIRNAQFLRNQRRMNFREIVVSYFGIFIEGFVTTFEKINFRIIQFRIGFFMNISIFRTKISQTKNDENK